MAKTPSPSQVVAVVKAKAARKNKPGKVAAREVKKYQQSTKHVCSHAQMERLIREIGGNHHQNLRFSKDAIEALHEASESYLVETLQQAHSIAKVSKHQTLMQSDFELALQMRGVSRPDPQRTIKPRRNPLGLPALAEVAQDVASQDSADTTTDAPSNNVKIAGKPAKGKVAIAAKPEPQSA